MSISFLQQPDRYVSGFNPIIFIAESDEIAQPNFRYLIEILDSTAAVIASFRKPPHYNFGTVKIDVHRTIENFLSYDAANLISGAIDFQMGVNVFKEFKVKVTEEYGSPFPSGALSVTSSTSFAINSAQTYLNYLNETIEGKVYYPSGTQDMTWLTNQPSIVKVREGDSYELVLISGTGGSSPQKLKVRTYDTAGVLLKTSVFDNNQKLNIVPAQRFLSALIGPGDINSWTVESGDVQPLIAADVDKYSVVMFDGATTDQSNTLTFEIDRDCLVGDTYDRIFWLNPLGRFDAFNFNRPHIDTISVEKSHYGRLLGTETASSFTYETYQSERSNFFNKSKQSYSLSSGFINTETSIWLKELIQSPLVYMIIDSQWVAINLVTTSYTAKTTQREKLFNIEIEVELSIDTQRQRL
jgi:hypothetical protein